MMNEKILSRSVRIIFSTGLAAGFAFAAQPALAQDAAAPMARVEITGSAIKRIDAETMVPVTILKMEDIKKSGITTIEQVMASLTSVQAQQTTSQVVGLGTGGATFADLRGVGSNKTLVLLNGRRVANNSFDGSSPDLNMIPFAALERVEVLRDGASSLYGSDAVGGVINFITRKNLTGGTITVGGDSPQHPGGAGNSANVGFGFGDLNTDGYNIYAMVDHQATHRIGGTQRDFNKRFPGGLSPTTSPANYYQDDQTGNPTAPTCATGSNLIPGASGTTSCQMTTSSFVDYIPKSERSTGLLKGTFKLNADHQLGFEYLASHSKVQSQIAPVPYGGLFQNSTRLDGSPNPFYPGNAGAITPNIPLSPTYTENNTAATHKPGFIHVKWRDLPNGPRADENINDQQRLIVSMNGVLSGWDYDAAFSYNENKVKENLRGYSDGGIITDGVLNGDINPFGPQSAAGNTLIASAALNGNIQNAKGTTKGVDFHASREVGDWFNAGRPVALAVGAQYDRQEFTNTANTSYAEKVVASTGIDPNLSNVGSRNVSAAFVEVSMPIIKTLDLTAAVRYDKYSDFGSTTNPKVGFRFQPTREFLMRGSYSTGFRAPSLYEINAAQTYTNSTQQDDPINCPGGKAIAGKPTASNCSQQFQELSGGNKQLSPEKSKNASLGFVYEPLNNLSLGLDFWWLKLSDQISSLDEDEVFAAENQGLYSNLYHRTADGNLATDGSQCPAPATCGYVDLRTGNLGDLHTNGIDLSASYRLKTADYGIFTFGAGATYVHLYEYQNAKGGVWHQNVGLYSGTGPVFKWQDALTLNWAGNKVAAGLSAHYKSGYLDQAGVNHVGDHQVATYTTFDTFATVQPFKGMSVTAGVRNMFDRQPPLSYQTRTFQAGYDPRFTDPTGRAYYVRATYSF
jgi:iron complex outermembrane receptor protein